MKKIVPWIKSNLLVVGALAVALIGVPVMIFFSAGMNKSLRQDLESQVSDVQRKLSGVSVNYEIPSLDPNAPAIGQREVPNKATTDEVVKRLELLAGLSEQARDRVIERNRQGREPLIQGLFPVPANESARIRLTAEMVEAWPAAHDQLLQDAHAGAPPAEGVVLRTLQNQRQRAIDAIEQNRVEEVTSEERAAIEAELVQSRLEVYRNTALRASFYGEASAFDRLQDVPAPENLPKIDEYQRLFWDWQHTYWVHEDIVSAITRANDSSRGWLAVPDAPVKRLLHVSVGSLALDEKVAVGSLAQKIERDFKVSPTGRKGGNPLYDVREARVELIVDAASVNTVINAFAHTNFMGVRGVSAVAYDATSDLRTGFDYGDFPVARLTLDIETVWIRSWMEPLMPPDVKADLGITSPEAGAAAGDEF